MNLLAFPTHLNWFHHIAELALLDHLSVDYKIYYLVCSASIPVCPVSLSPTTDVCKMCTQGHLKKLEGYSDTWSFHKFPPTDRDDISQSFTIPDKYEEIALLRLGNYEIGKTMIKGITIYDLDWMSINYKDQKVKQILLDIYITAAHVYTTTRKIIKLLNISTTLIFNGNQFPEEAFMAASQDEGIHFYVHERGIFPDKIFLARDHNPHHMWVLAHDAISTRPSESEIRLADKYLEAPTSAWGHKGFGANWTTKPENRDFWNDSEGKSIWTYFDSTAL